MPRPRVPRPLSLREISFLIDQTLDASAADETEIAWLEVRRGRAEARGARVEVRLTPERMVLVRVIDRGRVGSHRTGVCEAGELQDAVRAAVAQSRAREPLSGLPHLPADDGEPPTMPPLRDRELARLSARKARSLFDGLLGKREAALFDWAEARVAVFNSRAVRRAATVTAAQLTVECGRRAGAGRAVAAARSLADVDLAAAVEVARSRHGTGGLADPPAGPVTLVLAPEAMIDLVDHLGRVAFSAKAYYDGTSFLREHLGVQVFDRSLELVDDATDPGGIPFPFDLEGTLKRRIDLILKGAPKTPTLDQRQAAVLGLPPTAHAIGGNDSQALNLFLVAGESSLEEILEQAEGGLFVGSLAGIESLEPRRVQFRARARGVRRIAGGRLAEPVPDLWWEDSLLRALSDLQALGRDTTRRLTADGYLGGISAPVAAVGGAEGLAAIR